MNSEAVSREQTGIERLKRVVGGGDESGVGGKCLGLGRALVRAGEWTGIESMEREGCGAKDR